MAAAQTSMLLDLPVELFHNILIQAIKVRGLRRAFRLRLVNHFFAAEIIRVLNEYRLLDDCYKEVRMMGSVGVDYLSRRLLRTDLNLPIGARWLAIRDIAARLALEDDEAVREERYVSYVKLLCAQAAEHADLRMATVCLSPTLPADNPPWCRVDPYDNGDICDNHWKLDLMAAAAYTNKLSIIKELGEPEDHASCSANATFGNPSYLAALGGHHEAVDLLFSTCSREYGPGAWKRATLAKVCRIDSIDMAMADKFLSGSWDKKRLEDQCGRSMRLLEAALRTPNVEVFQAVMRIKESTVYPKLSESNFNLLLREAGRNGWPEMTQHLINMGAPHETIRDALGPACRDGQISVVRVLLDHMESPWGNEDYMNCAARGGHWDLVRLMVERGASINSQYRGHPMDCCALVAAVAFERADLVREFVALGARVDGEFGRKAVKRARDDGLESMLMLLEEMGAEGI
ncbi:hypothetical protein K458DRAFT_167240 [Lentithecium fluviatile CBS 122367]|uniref:Uncharacterized protein n=1 Tax=Lentithecium fluviatile CBS 122367 TaxID=1168545 RepID=A0A6G1JAK9_9PLEO|nr:hypothetical protein K458DRAFT_167240 [Lentithecium fluviatile CBS 122367]